MIPHSLKQLATPLADLRTHPRNPRQGNVDLIADSLVRYGQTKPIVVQASTGYIVAGNHTFKAAQQLEWQEIAALRLDFDEGTALKYLLMDNKASDEATYDDPNLRAILEELGVEGRQGTGFSEDDFEDITSGVGAVPEVDYEAFAGGYAQDAETTAAGYTSKDEHVDHKGLSLLYLPEDYERIMETIAFLKKAWGLSGNRDVVREALTRAADLEVATAAATVAEASP